MVWVIATNVNLWFHGILSGVQHRNSQHGWSWILRKRKCSLWMLYEIFWSNVMYNCNSDIVHIYFIIKQGFCMLLGILDKVIEHLMWGSCLSRHLFIFVLYQCQNNWTNLNQVQEIYIKSSQDICNFQQYWSQCLFT
jgi:hypothetical protein